MSKSFSYFWVHQAVFIASFNFIQSVKVVCQPAHLSLSFNIDLVTLSMMMERVLLLFGLVTLTTLHAVSINYSAHMMLYLNNFHCFIFCLNVCLFYSATSFPWCTWYVQKKERKERSVNKTCLKAENRLSCVCLCVAEVYENGEDENPIMNLGELQHCRHSLIHIQHIHIVLMIKTFLVFCTFALLQVQMPTCLKGTF